MAGYIWYDLECSGLLPAYDVPFQAAFIRTDEHLVVEEELVLRARVPDHIVPAPDAMIVTGQRPLDLVDAPLSQTQLMSEIAAFIAKAAPATILGFNQLAYDEEIIRAGQFQNLLRPYVTSLDGNRRADVLTMTRAIAVLAPGAIAIPKRDGRPVFRLVDVCRANGIDLGEDAAHDALNDVRATIALFRLLRDRAPDLVAALMENADKRSVQRKLDAGGVFGLINFGKILPVAALMASPTNPSSMAVADLGVDPASYLDFSQPELAAVMAAKGARPIRSVKLNAQPLLLPWNQVRAAAGVEEIVEALHRQRLLQINRHDGFWKTLPAAIAGRFADREPSAWPEGRLYDRFITDADARACQTWHRLAWEQRVPYAAETIADDRLRAFANRIAFLEAPHALGPEARRRGDAWLRHRLTTTDEVPWLTLHGGMARCAALRAQARDVDLCDRLDEISAWYAERLRLVDDKSLEPLADAL